MEFALEAKCYGPGNSVGVRETGRLISRLRYRQFGVLVTTSYVHSQGIREDGHPVVILAGRDIAEILQGQGPDTTEALQPYLQQKHPKAMSTDAPTAAEAVDGAIRLKRDMRVRGR